MSHTTLHSAAAHTLHVAHDAALHNLTKREAELQRIQNALQPALAGGLLTIERAETGRDGLQPLQIHVACAGPITKYPSTMRALHLAGLRAHTASFWKHPAGWSLFIGWTDESEAQHAAARFTEEVAA